MKLLYLIVVAICKYAISPVTNPNSIYSHTTCGTILLNFQMLVNYSGWKVKTKRVFQNDITAHVYNNLFKWIYYLFDITVYEREKRNIFKKHHPENVMEDIHKDQNTDHSIMHHSNRLRRYEMTKDKNRWWTFRLQWDFEIRVFLGLTLCSLAGS
jgi:hypothetical protein